MGVRFCLIMGLMWACIQLSEARSVVWSGERDYMGRGGMAQLQNEAERLWEQMIIAKGGRGRLHAVRSIVISSYGEYTTMRFKRNQIRQEALYVLPSKIWSWSDLRPDVFGLTMRMYDYSTKTKYIVSEGEPNRQPEPIEENEGTRERLLLDLLPYLPESRWLRPSLVRAFVGRIGERTVDIIQALVNGERVDFAIDQKTHLPIRVSFYSIDQGKEYVTNLYLSDYVEVEGIKMPRVVRYDGGPEYQRRYQFNVRYKEEIFVRPPSLEAGPEAWRAREQ